MGWIWITGLIFLIVIIWLISKSASNKKGGRAINKHEKTAMDLLKERYAEGEIDKEEFEQRKKDILT
mgnify:CR=1 FL=1